MSLDLEAIIERDESAMERIATAFEQIADTLDAWYKLDALRLEKQFPVKPDARDATVTRIPSDADKLRAEQKGEDEEESIGDWIGGVGLREQEFIDSEEGSKKQGSRATKTGRPRKARSK